jgi:hypothetical protein
VEHVRQIEIGNELPSAGEQTAILAARERTSDERSLPIIVHSRTALPDETMHRLASRARPCLPPRAAREVVQGAFLDQIDAGRPPYI